MRHKIIALALGLAACASPENRIETRLVEAGLNQTNAACIADELTDRLSLGQLQRLSTFVKTVANEDRSRRLTLGQLADRLDAIGDPEIVAAVTRAGLGCTLLGG